jgi:hypothetical protein
MNSWEIGEHFLKIFDMLVDLPKKANHKIEKMFIKFLFLSPLPTLATPPQKTLPYLSICSSWKMKGLVLFELGTF